MPIKTALDSAATSLISLGMIGLGFGCTQGKWVPGLFGIIAATLGIGVLLFRHIWNEGYWKTEGR